jgi:hypothetical protein
MILGIIVALFAFIVIWTIFFTLKVYDMQHRFDMENTYKIYLRRAEQRAYIYAYDIEPTLPDDLDSLVYYDTPAGTLHTGLTTMQFFRRKFSLQQVKNYNEAVGIIFPLKSRQ